jgi:hypothetical protein
MQANVRFNVFPLLYLFTISATALLVPAVLFAQGNNASQDKQQQQSPTLKILGDAKGAITVGETGVTASDSATSLLVNGKLYKKSTEVPIAKFGPGLTNVYVVKAGGGCRESGLDAADVLVDKPSAPVASSPNKTPAKKVEWGIRNNVSIPELKFVDQNWIQQKLTATSQALSTLSAFSSAPITAQYGVNQGIVSQSSFVSAQAGPTSALSAAIPTAPPAGTTPGLPTNFGSSPLDVLTQQVELNAQLMMYQAAFGGFASDNLLINHDGRATGVRRQITVAIPVSVTPMGPYKGAVAEVRIFLIPKAASSGNLSVMNLLPGSNTYNVAKITTDTKQLSAGATIEAVSLGVTAGKQRSALFLAKDMDTVSLQFENPSVQRDPDLSRTFGHRFRNLLPTGACSTPGGKGWADLKKSLTDSDLDRAIVFGWQFRPVLGDENVRSNPRLVMAQLALDGGEGGSPEAFVETRWREYDKKTGVVGAIYRDSCTWKQLADVAPLSYPPHVFDVQADDLGGGNVRIKVNGVFPDPNLQIRIGNTQRPIDFRSTDGKNLEIIASASTLLNAPNIDLVNAYGNTWPLVIPQQIVPNAA